MSGKCDIVIPSKNAPWWLALCLEELFKNTAAAELGRVLVVDDGSTPDSFAAAARLCARHTGASVLKNTGRAGFGGACNFGVSQTTAPFILFLNTDCLVVSGTIRKLVAACIADTTVGLACPLSNNSPSLTLPLLPGRSYMEMDTLLEEAAASLPASESVLDACTVVGNCLLITRACWDATGEFGAAWGQGYGEESDYQMRALEKGFRGVALTNAYVFHFGNGTFRYEPDANLLREKNHGLFMAQWGAKYEALRAQQRRRDPVKIAEQRLASAGVAALNPAVLFVLPVLAQGVGGVHAVVDLCNHLLRAGVDAKLAILGNFEAVQLKNFQEPIFFGLLHFAGEAEFLAQNRVAPRCVVGTYFTTMLPCLRYAVKGKIPAAYLVQGCETYFFNGTSYNAVSDTYAMADRLLVTSAWLKERMELHGLARPPAVLPIGIDLELFAPRQRVRVPKKFRLGMVLRDGPDKGQWVLLDLLKQLAPLRGQLQLTVLAARDYATPRGWSAAECRWLTLPLERAAVAAELAECDIFVDASFHEGFGLLPLEAMACGACVVVADSGGVKQYVNHGVNGLLVPEVNRPEKYTAAICRLLDDPALLERLQSGARATAAEYAADARYAAYAKFFRELLAAPALEHDAEALQRFELQAAQFGEPGDDKDQRVRQLLEERARIVNGLSFRVGRILTAPFRALFGRP